jgi:ATP-binding cassette subfamily B protein
MLNLKHYQTFVVKSRYVFDQLSYLPRTFRLVWTPARWWTVAWAAILVVQGLLPAASIYLTRILVDNIVVLIGNNGSWETIRPTLLVALLMVGIMIFSQVLQSVMAWVRATQAELVRDYLSTLIHEKATTVDLAFYEIPAYHDRLERARSDLQSRPLALLENGGSLVQSTITLIAIMGLLLPYGLWLPFVLLLGTLPTFFVVLRFNRRYYRWWEKTTQDRRKTQYYEMLLTQNGAAAEVRLFDLGPHFRLAYQTLRRRLRNESLKLARDQSLAQLGAGLVGLFFFGLTLMWLIWQAIQGLITLGDLTLFYQSFNRGQGVLSSFLGSIGQIYTNILFLGNLFEFLELEPQIVDSPGQERIQPTLKKEITFRQVTFRYPGSERAVFENFNFSIPAHKIVAIVGTNGAGKTTLIKLLTRFYEPESGYVEMDGVNLRHLPVADLRRMITTLFQFPMPYFDTVAANIAMGDITASPGRSDIEAAARSAGAHDFITRLSKGYDTPLGKWFAGGTELSGGEWQRLALARAFLRHAQIMILDEPTSFMDSWSEIDWFDRLRELANGRTTLIITHRFTIARHADIIHMMDAGQIVESGTHEELLALGKRYAQSWKAQTEARNTRQNNLAELEPASRFETLLNV